MLYTTAQDFQLISPTQSGINMHPTIRRQLKQKQPGCKKGVKPFRSKFISDQNICYKDHARSQYL